jgi:hypothetical protein
VYFILCARYIVKFGLNCVGLRLKGSGKLTLCKNMKKTEFDQFADEYELLHARNIRISGQQPKFFAQYKVIVFPNFLN